MGPCGRILLAGYAAVPRHSRSGRAGTTPGAWEIRGLGGDVKGKRLHPAIGTTGGTHMSVEDAINGSHNL